MNRRHFIESVAAGISLGMFQNLIPGLQYAVRAANGEPHFFVMICVEGGMDVTLGLDPQVLPEGVTLNEFFIEYAADQILAVDNIRFAPAAHPLLPFAKESATINGIVMSLAGDPGHETCRAYMASGVGNSAPYLSVEVAAGFGQGPHGVVSGNEGTGDAQKGNRSNVMVSRVNDLSQLKLKTGSGSGFDPKDLLGSTTPGRKDPLSDSRNAFVASGEVTRKFVGVLEEMKKSLGGPLRHHHVLAASMSVGASSQGFLNLGGDLDANNLDTHTSHEKFHLERQTYFFSKIADILNFFKSTQYKDSGKSLYDLTTFMVSNEFSKTPNLSSSVGGGGGKDHNAKTNSTILIGKNIKGGQTFGQSVFYKSGDSPTGRTEHMGVPFDFENGMANPMSDNARFLRPENVAATVRDIMGIPVEKFTSIKPNVPSILGIKKT